jgi:3-oxoacyl-[acyl-carrier protein] reductase
MDLGLAGKVALVTGASRGIGRASALRLPEGVTTLALAARDEATFRAVAAQAETSGAQALVPAVDLTSPAAVATAAVVPDVPTILLLHKG